MTPLFDSCLSLFCLFWGWKALHGRLFSDFFGISGPTSLSLSAPKKITHRHSPRDFSPQNWVSQGIFKIGINFVRFNCSENRRSLAILNARNRASWSLETSRDSSKSGKYGRRNRRESRALEIRPTLSEVRKGVDRQRGLAQGNPSYTIGSALFWPLCD